MTTVRHATHVAVRPGRSVIHIVTGVANLDPANPPALPAECGQKYVLIKDEVASKESHPTNTCKRCLHSLGWDL